MKFSLRKTKPKDQRLLMSPYQLALWWSSEEYEIEDFNLYIALKIDGDIDVERLRRACLDTMAVCDASSLYFDPTSEEDYQYLAEPGSAAIEQSFAESDLCDELGSLDTTARRSYLLELLNGENRREIPLDRPPLARFQLYRIGRREYLLAMFATHLGIDGIGMALGMSNIVATYDKPLSTQADIDATRSRFSFLSYLAEEQSQLLSKENKDYGERAQAFYRDLFSGGYQLTNFTKPEDYYDLNIENWGVSKCIIDAEPLREISAALKKQPSTLFNLLMTLTAVWLHLYTGKEKVVVATFVNTRPRSHSSSIGMFANQVVYPFRFDQDCSLAQLVVNTSAISKRFRRFQNYPFFNSAGPGGLFTDPVEVDRYCPDVTLVETTQFPSLHFGGANVDYFSHHSGRNYENLHIAYTRDDTLQMEFDYFRPIFANVDADCLTPFKRLLNLYVEKPQLRLSELRAELGLG